jgi:hypothetical protein
MNRGGFGEKLAAPVLFPNISRWCSAQTPNILNTLATQTPLLPAVPIADGIFIEERSWGWFIESIR